MAMTPAEKKAYQKEYYQKYTKKGLKKGRKKSSKKKAATSSLVGTSTSGLNSDGKIEAALIKEKIKSEMNAALAKAKTSEERENIRREYSKKANAELEKLRNDPRYAKAKKQRASSSKSSGGSKSSKSSKSSSGNKSSKESSSKNSGSAKSTNTSEATTATTSDTNSTQTMQTLKDLTSKIDELKVKIEGLTPEQKETVKSTIQDIIDKLKMRLQGQWQTTAQTTQIKS